MVGKTRAGYAAQNSESRRTDVCRKCASCLDGEVEYDDEEDEGEERGLEFAVLML